MKHSGGGMGSRKHGKSGIPQQRGTKYVAEYLNAQKKPKRKFQKLDSIADLDRRKR